MRILHVSKYYSPYMGGVENICKYLVENMPLHQTAVVCFNEAEADCADKVGEHNKCDKLSRMNKGFFDGFRMQITKHTPRCKQI